MALRETQEENLLFHPSIHLYTQQLFELSEGHGTLPWTKTNVASALGKLTLQKVGR